MLNIIPVLIEAGRHLKCTPDIRCKSDRKLYSALNVTCASKICYLFYKLWTVINPRPDQRSKDSRKGSRKNGRTQTVRGLRKSEIPNWERLVEIYGA